MKLPGEHQLDLFMFYHSYPGVFSREGYHQRLGTVSKINGSGLQYLGIYGTSLANFRGGNTSIAPALNFVFIILWCVMLFPIIR